MRQNEGKVKKRKGRKSIWSRNVLTRKIVIPFYSITQNIQDKIKENLERALYDKCSKEGYVKTNSIKILSYSSGLMIENNVEFSVMFECLICHPVEGQIIKCQAKNITRAGIRALYTKEEKSPITIFIARDHHYNSENFSRIKEGDDIMVKVIGIRFELNDTTISVLGELKLQKQQRTKVIIE